MYASVRVNVGKEERYITLPQTAVIYNPYGDTVFLVKDNIAKQVFVSVGDTRGDQIAILKGVNEGDIVVTTGQLKLKNGSQVIINNQIQPAFEPAPQPVDE